jgi:hypothetical protein
MKIKRVWILFLFLVESLLAQQDSKIILFNGGHVHYDLSLSGNFMQGISGRATRLGSICSFKNEASSGYQNPAFLAHSNNYTFQFDFAPPVSLNVAEMLDINGQISQATDDAISDYRDSELNPVYTQADAILSQQDQINSLILIFPFLNTGVAGYFVRPVQMAMAATVTGIQTRIVTKMNLSENDDDVIFNSFIDGNLEFDMGLQTYGFALGREINDRFSAGLAFERTDMLVYANGRLNVDGTMLFGGKENTFNDPRDNWHNDLNQSLNAQYRGSDWGWKLGGSWRFNENFMSSVVMDWQPNISASGDMKLVNNAIPALSLGKEDKTKSGEDEILDPSKLKLSQLTLTRQVDNKIYQRLTMNQPKILKIGAAYQWNWLALHLCFSKGFTPLSFIYGTDEIGLKLVYTLRLGLDFKYLQVGLGLMQLQKIARGSDKLRDGGESISVPLFSIGTDIHLRQNLDLQVVIAPTPLPMIKFGWGLFFNSNNNK